MNTNTAGIQKYGYSEAHGNAYEAFHIYESDGTFKEIDYPEAQKLGILGE